MSAALSEVVLIGAVLFNAILAVINGHVVALERIHVVFAELAIYGAALSLIFFNADRKMMPWFLLTLFILLLGTLLAAGNGAFNAKYLRDVLVIPVFVMLGMIHDRNSLVRPLVILQTVVLLVALLEAIWPDAYAEVFRILQYYVNTRDFAQNQFWNTESTLFVSATRPGARFFDFVDLHRLSSIFLEPVSLGNYCVIAAIAVAAIWFEMTTWLRLYMMASTVVLLIGCDGRLAAASIAIIVVLIAFFRVIPSRWAAAYLPAILIASAAYCFSSNAEVTGDTFGGRLAGSLLYLSEIDLTGLLGFDASSSDSAADSGIAYFLLTQSVVGVAVIWLCITLIPEGRDYSSQTYVHAISVFIPLNLMVSYSFFSIKVAALIWFCYGHLYMKSLLANQQADSGAIYQLPEIDVAA